jgi:Fic-DOC domain mobile mystery protein B
VAAGVTDATGSPFGPDPIGATPLSEDDLEGAIPLDMTTRADLNRYERQNIAEALPWALRRARLDGPSGVLDFAFLFRLHRRMFGQVWTWAGGQRRRETNVGVDPAQISSRTKQALDDAIYWHDNATFEVDELSVRIHFRLVDIHPFPNGNGRCTRLVADLYRHSIGMPFLPWGGVAARLDGEGAARKKYIDAIIEATTGNFEPLIDFARSEEPPALAPP